MAERYIHKIGIGHGRVKSAASEHLERNPVLSHPAKSKAVASRKKIAKHFADGQKKWKKEGGYKHDVEESERSDYNATHPNN